MNGAIARVTGTFKAFTPGQKAVTAFALVALVVGGLLFSRWAGQPTYAPLFTGLAGEDASAIVEELNASGTPYELADGGATVLVPREAVYDTRIAMSGEGLPAGEATGYSLLDEQSMTSSEFQQNTAYKRALEGELSKTVQAIDGVQVAVVHLAIPQKDVFTEDEDKPTASVLVETKPGDDLDSQQVQAIVNLVASSVEGMEPGAVTVADSTGRVLSAGEDGGTGGAAGDVRSQQTREYEDRVSSSLQTMLDRVVGPGRSVVRLTADLDFDQTQTTSETYNPSTAAPLADSTETETYTGGAAAQTGGALGSNGVLGPDNDANLANGGAGGAESAYEKTKRTVNNSVNKVTEVRKSAPGAVRGLDVAVLLDTKTGGALDPAQVQALVSSAAGIDTRRGDTIQVNAMPFDESAAEAAAADLAEAKAAEAAAARSSLYKVAGIAVLGVLALLYTFLAARRRRKKAAALSDAERIQLERLQEALELQAANEAAALEGASQAPALEAAQPVDPRIGQLALARDEISEMVQNQPEQVAQLLRGWMADRRS